MTSRTIGSLAARFVRERSAAVIIFAPGVPRILARTEDDIDRGLAFALRMREYLHARGYRIGESLP